MNPIIRKMDALVVGGLQVRSADGGDLSHLGDRLARLRVESGDWGASPTAYRVVFDFQLKTGSFGYLASCPEHRYLRGSRGWSSRPGTVRCSRPPCHS